MVLLTQNGDRETQRGEFVKDQCVRRVPNKATNLVQLLAKTTDQLSQALHGTGAVKAFWASLNWQFRPVFL